MSIILKEIRDTFDEMMGRKRRNLYVEYNKT